MVPGALLLTLEDLVDEAFRLGGGVAVEVGGDGVAGDEGALAAVGVGRVKDDLGISQLVLVVCSRRGFFKTNLDGVPVFVAPARVAVVGAGVVRRVVPRHFEI
jgi:hypothetical protein